MVLPPLLLGLLLAGPTAPQAPGAAPPEAAETLLDVPPDGSRLALREMDGDGRIDILMAWPGGFGVRFQRADGSYPAQDDSLLAWPGQHLAWDVIDLDGDGVFEVVFLTGEGEVWTHTARAERRFGEGRLLLQALSYLPHGVSRMHFARDVNGDGLGDLVLPGSGRFSIFLALADGGWSEPFEIAYEAEVRYEMGDPEELETRFGQRINLPWFRIEDVDGDGDQDLVSQTERRVDFHLATPQLASQPSWSLDLAALQAEQPSREGVDLDDLLSNIDLGINWRIEELDGEAPRDLVLQVGSTVKVYLGGAVTGVQQRPDQVLRISGNLLHFLLRDVQGDELPDLQLLRGERISLGRVLRWLILPGSLDFEFFTYRNDAGVFTRKPTKRNTLSLAIPRLLSLIEDVDEIKEEFDRQRAIPTRRADLDGDGVENDVVDVEQGRVLLFEDCAPPAERDMMQGLREGDLERIAEDFFLEDLDRMEDGGTKTIDLGDYAQWEIAPGAELRAARQGRQPVLSFACPLPEEELQIRPLDLDGDGGSDLVIFTRLEDGSHRVQILVLP